MFPGDIEASRGIGYKAGEISAIFGLGAMDPQQLVVARRNMVDCQLKPNRITDPRLLAAMDTVPREAFVSRNLRGVAYLDETLPVGNGRHLMTPMVLGRLLQVAEIRPTDTVLVVGCATGYGAAITARLAAGVVALECDTVLADAAAEILPDQGGDAVLVERGALGAGSPRHAPYEVILVEGLVDFVPDALLDQLAEGGRLLAVVDDHGVGKATLWQKQHGRVGQREVFDAAAPRLPGFERVPGFVF
jgi:protein-L-isoaspartate(D-aspartate) O-methyltransferase